ncbi:hypothetical protein [Corynebacterium sp.]|uniref:hypothetical protein n=1 Tax=Corynebacterium sp. TaxID=1720 RepID=UPI0026DC6848|nr:hypothetical protein [Corynebacterium sp.]MDO5031267.1 hypothetical protein [Corynebacterium sp.]
MPEVFFDEEEAPRLLSNVMEQAREQAHAHGADVPDFPAASTGRDFGGHGVRIQTLLTQLHQRGAWRLNNIERNAQAARDQFAALSAVDAQLAQDFARQGQVRS